VGAVAPVTRPGCYLLHWREEGSEQEFSVLKDSVAYVMGRASDPDRIR
jgi:hypothetical protein